MKKKSGPISPVDLLSDEEIRQAVEGKLTWKSIVNSLGLKIASAGIIRHLRERCAAMNLSIERLAPKGGGLNKGQKQNPLDNPTVKAWRRGEICGHTGKTMMVKPVVREYMKAKAGYKCEKCQWGEINPTTGKVPLQINHIDGNPQNTIEINLEAICPNCHSLTPTYMNLNKGNGRGGRK